MASQLVSTNNIGRLLDLGFCHAVLQFLNFSQMDDRINAIHIALIPKKSNPCRVSDFLPIGLCNVMYKLISKALANRLKEVLPHVISSTQHAFLAYNAHSYMEQSGLYGD
jgi:hypothetical protein